MEPCKDWRYLQMRPPAILGKGEIAFLNLCPICHSRLMAELRTFRLIPPHSGTGDRISHCESPVTCSQIPADNLQGDDDKLVSADGTNTKRCLIVGTFFLVLKKKKTLLRWRTWNVFTKPADEVKL